MKASEFIMQYLKKYGEVDTVFTFAGGSNAFLVDAVYRNKLMNIVSMHHEQNAAFAAEGYARAAEKMGLALTMSGPGATNLITGIANAYFDSVPVFYLTGQVASTSYKFDKPIRQLGYQETDIVSLVKPITKYAEITKSPKDIVPMLRESISECISPRQGSVLLDVPIDFQKEEIEDSELDNAPITKPNRQPNEKEINETIESIKESKRPIILAGGGIRSSKTNALLTRFARTFKIPVVLSLLGKDSFPNDDPLYVGFIGTYGNRYANLALANCDLLLALGTRLDSRQTATPSTFARAAKKIHVEIDETEIDNTLTADININCHLKDFFEKIFEVAEESPSDKYKDWMNYIKDLKNKFEYIEDADVDPKKVLKGLSEFFYKDEIFTTDVGIHQMWCAQTIEIKNDQRMLTSGGLGSMNFGIPAAIGAHYACPNKTVITIVGDGGFQMSIPELQTISHYKIPLKIIIFNNNVLGLMRSFQDENFEGRHPTTEEGYSCPNIEAVAKAFGIDYIKVDSNTEIKPKMDYLSKSKGPIIMEVMIDKNLKAYPKIRGKSLENQVPEIDPEILKKYMIIPLLDK